MENQDVLSQKMQAPRGTRDFFGTKKKLRDAVLSTLKGTFEKYCFEPLETPAFENIEVLGAKFAGGEEILKETYCFEDQGGRKLGLRYDFTVPLCRFVASNPSLPKPIKRYTIGTVWRDGPLKVGRYREFTQCDADIVGASSLQADAEVLALMCDALNSLGLQFKIRVNNRKLLKSVLEAAGISGENELSAILSLDKLAKIGWEGVEKELIGKQVCTQAQLAKLKSILSQGEGQFDKKGTPGMAELDELFSLADQMGFSQFLVRSPTLARGLNYYTGNIFEAYLQDGEQIGITSSIAAGGRYDEIIGDFLSKSTNRSEKVPAVGVSFGLDVICEALEKMREGKENESAALPPRVFVIPIGQERESLSVVQRLRKAGVAASIDLLGRGAGKNLEYAAKRGFSYAIFVGKAEVDASKVKLRNLKSGEEKTLPLSEAIALVLK